MDKQKQSGSSPNSVEETKSGGEPLRVRKKERNVSVESTRRRFRVEKNTGPASCQCAYMGTSDRLVSGFSLFHCGLWQLNTSREENRSSDSFYSYE